MGKVLTFNEVRRQAYRAVADSNGGSDIYEEFQKAFNRLKKDCAAEGIAVPQVPPFLLGPVA